MSYAPSNSTPSSDAGFPGGSDWRTPNNIFDDKDWSRVSCTTCRAWEIKCIAQPSGVCSHCEYKKWTCDWSQEERNNRPQVTKRKRTCSVGADLNALPRPSRPKKPRTVTGPGSWGPPEEVERLLSGSPYRVHGSTSYAADLAALDPPLDSFPPTHAIPGTDLYAFDTPQASSSPSYAVPGGPSSVPFDANTLGLSGLDASQHSVMLDDARSTTPRPAPIPQLAFHPRPTSTSYMASAGQPPRGRDALDHTSSAHSGNTPYTPLGVFSPHDVGDVSMDCSFAPPLRQPAISPYRHQDTPQFEPWSNAALGPGILSPAHHAARTAVQNYASRDIGLAFPSARDVLPYGTSSSQPGASQLPSSDIQRRFRQAPVSRTLRSDNGHGFLERDRNPPQMFADFASLARGEYTLPSTITTSAAQSMPPVPCLPTLIPPSFYPPGVLQPIPEEPLFPATDFAFLDPGQRTPTQSTYRGNAAPTAYTDTTGL
ncbi:transcription factor [Ganoderma sinense ZZ0214-1]|uniref:Transcription factor n=1 Tax=Ganoderma sinense ZZ0214-1 TaxID=1077348 RepID=A0A2G8RXJ8_9APHY|nr:transcription factor [Ganoderma sinense ZZ0214-1]